MKGMMDGIAESAKAFYENTLSALFETISEIQKTINQISNNKAWVDSIKKMTDIGNIWAEEITKKQAMLKKMMPSTSAIESIAPSIQRSLSVTSGIDISKI